MTLKGRVQNGVVIPEESDELPEGAEVRIEIVDGSAATAVRRRGGFWKGQVRIAEDFDDLPGDLTEAFGIDAE